MTKRNGYSERPPLVSAEVEEALSRHATVIDRAISGAINKARYRDYATDLFRRAARADAEKRFADNFARGSVTPFNAAGRLWTIAERATLEAINSKPTRRRQPVDDHDLLVTNDSPTIDSGDHDVALGSLSEATRHGAAGEDFIVDQLDLRNELAELAEAVNDLDEDARELLAKRLLDNNSYKKIGAKKKQTENALRSAMFRIRRALRKSNTRPRRAAQPASPKKGRKR